MEPPSFRPADGATVEDYQSAIRENLSFIDSEFEKVGERALRNLRLIFEGSSGVLETPEGRVGFERTTIKTYDPDTIRSLLGEWAWQVIHNERVMANSLEKLIKKLKQGRVIDSQFAKTILDSCTKQTVTTFIAHPWTEAERLVYQSKTAQLRPACASAERFKGRCI